MNEPYYQDEWVTIYHGDCREILPELPKVDLVLTDPPYNAPDIGVKHRTYGSSVTMSLPPDEYTEFCHTWYKEADRIADGLIFTPGIKNIWLYPPARWVLAWSKPGAVCFNATGGWNIWEPILLYGKTGKFVHDLVTQTPLNFGNTLESRHPCPKPPTVWDWLIASATVPGGYIIDPFLGSGTTAYCAKKLNRKSIGIEIEEKYCEIAANRCRQMVMDLR